MKTEKPLRAEKPQLHFIEYIDSLNLAYRRMQVLLEAANEFADSSTGAGYALAGEKISHLLDLVEEERSAAQKQSDALYRQLHKYFCENSSCQCAAPSNDRSNGVAQ